MSVAGGENKARSEDAALLEIRALAVFRKSSRGLSPGEQGPRPVLRSLSLTLQRGEVLGLAGESGAGKSTVGKAVSGLLPEGLRISGGEILLDGEALLSLSAREMRQRRGRRIGMIFQDPTTALNPYLTVGAHLAGTIRHLRGTGKAESEKQAEQWLDRSGFPRPRAALGLYPHEFSGGMRQRAVIAMALCGLPDLLIADEPTTALDLTVQARILDLLEDLKREYRPGMLLISHDMGVMARLADRIALLANGEAVESGPASRILTRPESAQARQMMRNIPRLSDPVPPSRTGEQETLLDISGLCFRPKQRTSRLRVFRKQDEDSFALQDISLSLRAGEAFGLVGESGSGKTTLARVIAGLFRPDRGTITMKADERAVSSQKKRHDINMLFQNPWSALNPCMTIGEALAEPLRFYRLVPDEGACRQRVRELLSQTGLDPARAGQFPASFSGGERQRIALARALASAPRLLICDEPTSSLDMANRMQVLGLLDRLRRETGLTLLFITHDLMLVRQLCSRLAVLKDGRICESGSVSTVLEAPQHAFSRQLRDSILPVPALSV